MLIWPWIVAGIIAAGIITVSVVITVSIIRDLLNDSNVIEDGFSAHIERKIQDGNYTKIKVNFKNLKGNTVTKEIKSEYGADVYEGQTIYS